MSVIKLTPRFNVSTRTLAFPSKELNVFTSELLRDSFDFYQRTFGVFSFMTLSSSLKFIISTLGGNPMLWTPHNACAWEPNGLFTIGTQEVIPSKAKINIENCYDELFNGAYEDFLRWDGRGEITMSATGQDYMDKLVQTIVQNAALGARLTLTVGEKYDVNAITFKAEVPQKIQELFGKTNNTAKGYMKLLQEVAVSNAKYAHLNVSSIFNAADMDGKKYVGDVVELYENLKANAPYDLESIINEGGVIGAGTETEGRPLILVSTSIFNAIVDHYNKTCVSLACVNPRVTMSRINEGNREFKIYNLDSIPVIPMSDVNYYDKYLTGTTHFIAITTAGNINLGTAWDSLPDPNSTTNDIGLLIERSTRLQDLGKNYAVAHNLMASAISSADQIVAAQVYAEPA